MAAKLNFEKFVKKLLFANAITYACIKKAMTVLLISACGPEALVGNTGH